MEEIACFESGLDIFLLPSFLFFANMHLSWTRWRSDDAFLVKLLISMTHRWYTALGQNPEHTDMLVAKSPISSGGKLDIVGLPYSNTTMVGMQVTDMNTHSSSSGLNILLCNRSMLVTNSSCLDGHAMCNDGTCILSHYVCDGRPECPDESDELDCGHVCSFADGFKGNLNCFTSCITPECVCHALYFSCALGGCIPWSRVCNMITDWPNGEDEQICVGLKENSEKKIFVERNFRSNTLVELDGDLYTCKNGPNISYALVNDLVPDCPEQDDEEQY